MANLNEFVTADEMAKWLGVDRPTLLRWVREDGMPCIRLGNRVFFHGPNVGDWLLSREARGESGTGSD
jgi:excisionase family DNA binding protein